MRSELRHHRRFALARVLIGACSCTSSAAFAFLGQTYTPTAKRSPERYFVRATGMPSLSAKSSPASSTEVGGAEQDPLVALGLTSPLILGSASFTRKQILREMGVNYRILVRPIDEKSVGDRTSGDAAASLVFQLAKAKGDHLAASILSGEMHTCGTPPQGGREEAMEEEVRRCISDRIGEEGGKGLLLLTADQVVTHEGRILEKPESTEEAKVFVEGYARSPPSTVGACVITHVPSLVQVGGVDSARINFKPSVATGGLIDRLLADGAPVLSCAGGLMVEHPFVKEHIAGIEGTEDSVMGLSKDLVLELLNKIKTSLDESEMPT